MTSSHSPPSSSSHVSRIKYDVFISFRGLDTRRGFLSHLRRALCEKQIEAYVDDKLREGDELLPSLFAAIQESQIALIIFSGDYASSKWCLEELVKITECKEQYGQIVVPIFYNIDPSDVRHQKGCYKDAFAQHQILFKDNMVNVEKWRIALKKATNLSGFHSKNFGTEAELIEVVVQRVLTRLNHRYQVDLKGLVGIDKPIVDLQSLISGDGSKDVWIIGIWGMGGIGKTTIAGALFNKLCPDYEGCFFLENVREQSEEYGIIQLRDKLLPILLEEKDLKIGTPNGVPAHVLRRIHRKKILVVLDDINNPDQVRNLVGGHDWLGPGSRIIVTTRDKHVISKEADDIYEVKALKFHEALHLFKLHAFKEQCLNMNLLMQQVANYAKGIPLALKVLGSFLYGKSAGEWESQLEKLQKMPCLEIQNVLRLSYEQLDREERDVFLYIACFFSRDTGIKQIKCLLDACGYSTVIALRTLQDKALITVSKGYIGVHDLILEMSREIVREQSVKKPGDRSHLWDPGDIYRVLKHNEGTDHIKSITLNMSRIKDLSLNPQSFARMINLNFLKFYTHSYSHSRVHLPEGLGTLPDSIVSFHWDEYPSESFPVTFNAENLVEICMVNSQVKNLWHGVQNLTNLIRLNLSESKHLIELPDFSKASRLEDVCLWGCVSLLYVHPSILSLQKLLVLDLRRCERLENLQSVIPSRSLETFIATGCSNLREFSVFGNKIQQLFLEGTAIDALPTSIEHLGKVKYLYLARCENLKRLPDSLSKLGYLECLVLSGCTQLDTSNLHTIFRGLWSLRRLYLNGCCNLTRLPQTIGMLSSLKVLSVERTNLKSLPKGIMRLLRLEYLYLRGCMRLQFLPEVPPSVRVLHADNCTSLERVSPKTRDRSFGNLFTFNNCPKLDEDEPHSILAYESREMREADRRGKRARTSYEFASNRIETVLSMEALVLEAEQRKVRSKLS